MAVMLHKRPAAKYMVAAFIGKNKAFRLYLQELDHNERPAESARLLTFPTVERCPQTGHVVKGVQRA